MSIAYIVVGNTWYEQDAAKAMIDRASQRLGMSGARDEILLAATAQNLRKLAIHAARSPPGPRLHCSA